MHLFDTRGHNSVCLIWLVQRAQCWAAGLGHDQVFKEFCQASRKKNRAIEIDWDSPEKIRAWLNRKTSNQEETSEEGDWASNHSFKGNGVRAGNPALLELKDTEDLEKELLQNRGFVRAITSTQQRICSQSVSVSCTCPWCHMKCVPDCCWCRPACCRVMKR